MAVDYFEPSYHERDAESDTEKTVYHKSWLIRTDDIYESAMTVLDHPDLDAIGSTYLVTGFDDLDNEVTIEEDPDATCEKIVANQDKDNPLFWIVIADFSTASANAEDPLNEEPEKEWRQVKYKKAIFKDRDDNSIVNSAGEPFLPPREIELHYWRLTYTRNEASFEPGVFDDYIDALNAVAWKGRAPFTVKVESIEAKRMKGRNGWFWKVTYVIAWNDDGWAIEILDRGRNELIAGVLTPIQATGTGIPSEKLLDGTGRVLAVGADPIYLPFDVLHLQDINDLNIGSLD